ncbi:MAG: KpsF/GutQ family sugar-phosphate isomerase [Acidobacteria bacterium]|nr:KpsF/GutQ family sugar-phosphate isomerase [Acidobacteriota bacterium]
MLGTGKQVLLTEATAIVGVAERLSESFERAVRLMALCKGRIICTGMGKSGIVCQKMAATLTSTGTPAHFLHPAEAIHGDLGMVRGEDLVLAISYSGETEELLRLLEMLKRIGTPLIALTGNMQSSLARHSDVALDVGVEKEACPMGLAPTASTTAALAMGDALAMSLLRLKGFRAEDFAELHPGGNLGRQLLPVSALMQKGEAIPSVRLETPMKDVIYEISRKGLGVTAVVDGEGRPVGIITDGDLRRLIEQHSGDLLSRTAGQCMHPNPKTIEPGELATTALRLMEERRITSLLVVDAIAAGIAAGTTTTTAAAGGSGMLVGVIHLHDLWRTQMF